MQAEGSSEFTVLLCLDELIHANKCLINAQRDYDFWLKQLCIARAKEQDRATMALAALQRGNG